MDRTLAIATCLAWTLAACSSSSREECPATALCRAPDRAPCKGDDCPRDAGPDSGSGSRPDAGAAPDAAPGVDAAQSEPACADRHVCPELCPQRLMVMGGTRNLGHCGGDCGFNVGFEFGRALESRSCVTASATLTVHGSDGRGRKAQAALTEAAWDEIARISLALENTTIGPAPSCADCPGKASVRFHPTDAMSGLVSTEREYPIGMPPVALRDADAFVQALIDQLALCRGPLFDTCEVREIPEPSDPAHTCNFSLKNGGASFVCNVPFGADAPCRVAVTCLCRSGALSGGAGDMAGCVDAWLGSRSGARTFADFCTEGETDTTHSLWAALIQFGNANGYTAGAGSDCDQVQAFY